MKICEVFKSIQGEGLLMGLPCVFVRTSGCNLDCAWCDTRYARSGGEEMTVMEIIDRVRGFDIPLVCITGGEPLLQQETYSLVDRLLDEGYSVQLETNGSIPLEKVSCHENLMISMDFKTPSSGMQKRMIKENLEVLSPYDQLKFIVADSVDMRFVEEFLAVNEIPCPVVVTPVGGTDIRPVAEWVLKKNLNVRVLPQLHKLIWGEERGR